MENQRLKELAGLITEKKWSGKVATKWKPEEGLFTKKAGAIVAALMAAPGGAKKAMSRLNFFINRAGEKLENKEELEKAKAAVSKKIAAMKEEIEGVARRAGILTEAKKKHEDFEDSEPDMDMGDGGEEAPKAKGKGDEEEETLPKIVKKIAKKAVGKDVEELEDLIMKVYNAGHKDGEKAASEEGDVKESVVEAVLTELMDMGAMKKAIDPKEMRKRIITGGGNPFGGKKKEEKKPVKEDDLSEKHHVKKGGKVTKKGSKAECDAHAAKDGGEVMKGDAMTEEELTEKHHVKKGKKVVKKGSKKECDDFAADKDGMSVHKGEPETEEVDECADEDLVDIETSVAEDYEQIKTAMARVETNRVGKPCMTPKGKGVVTGVVKQVKAGADGKAGPYVHSVTVKMGDNTVHTMPANQVKLFKGKTPDKQMLPKGVSSTAINNADSKVTAKGTQANEPGKMPSTKSMWKA